ncbi:MAG: phenylacetic acid degradation b [Alphaproteobacteria bacterium]|jgi:1,2-phenylacetyl-CoA epoxidase PaaB subunit
MKRKQINRTVEIGGNRTKFYEVFARKDSHDVLAHVGSIEAPNDDLAQVRAWYVYDQHKWKEMCLVPTDAIVSVTEHDKRVKIKEV